MDIKAAKKAVAAILRNYTLNRRSLYGAIGHDQGKVYELFVLSILISCLDHAGCQITVTTPSIRFKGKPGFVQAKDTAFEVKDASGSVVALIHLNIQYQTLGSSMSAGNRDNSFFHEFDISIANPAAGSRPTHKDLMLGIECKSNGCMSKSYVREVLGLRREMSFHAHDPQVQSSLTEALSNSWNVWVSSEPSSEIYLAYSDIRKGSRYRQSPASFSVGLVGLRP